MAAAADAPKRWSRAAEEKLRSLFLHEARERCKDEMTAFAQCAKAAGFMVVFRCRDAQSAANACVKQHSSDEKYAEYKRTKKEEWIKQGVLLPDP